MRKQSPRLESKLSKWKWSTAVVGGRGDLSHHANGSVSIHFKARGHLIADCNSAMGAYMGFKKKEKVLIVLGNVTRYHNLQPEQFRLGVRGKKKFLQEGGRD